MFRDEITLVAAAAKLKVPWHTAHRLVLTGALTGEQRYGRWYVDETDVNRIAESRHASSQIEGR